jgi:hypothetical protein
MMKGNEKDCICAKSNGKHTKRCDAYRLSKFLIEFAAVVREKPTPPDRPITKQHEL